MQCPVTEYSNFSASIPDSVVPSLHSAFTRLSGGVLSATVNKTGGLFGGCQSRGAVRVSHCHDGMQGIFTWITIVEQIGV